MWYSVRTLYLWGQKADGINVFEERVVTFEAKSDAEVFAKAQKEANTYADGDGEGYEVYPEQTSYQLLSDNENENNLIDGYEVWSQLFEGYETLEEFYQNRYAQYEYHPDTT